MRLPMEERSIGLMCQPVKLSQPEELSQKSVAHVFPSLV